MHFVPFIFLTIIACALFVSAFLVEFGSTAQFALLGVTVTILVGLTFLGIKE
ncbi:hypothetical protein D3C76_1188070 [compost metagenome]